jgi:hypothetical protein
MTPHDTPMALDGDVMGRVRRRPRTDPRRWTSPAALT